MVKKFKNKFFYRLFLPYILIFIIPMLVWGIFTYRYAYTERIRAEQSIVSKLDFIQSTVAVRIKELNNVAFYMIQNPNMQYSFIKDHPYNSYVTLQDIRKYKALSNVLDIGLYFYGQDIIYTSQGLSSYSVYCVNNVMSGYNYEDYFNQLNNSKFPQFITAYSEQINFNGDLHYVFPLSSNGVLYNSAAVFIISRSIFDQMADSMMSDYEGVLYIVDERGNILYSKSKIMQDSDTLRKEVLGFASSEQVYSLSSQSGTLSVVKTFSPNIGLTYYLCVSQKQFFKRIINSQQANILLFICVLIVCSFIWARLAIRQYKPMRDLIHHFRKDSSQNCEIINMEDMANIIIGTKEDLLSRLDCQNQLARGQLILRLLDGTSINQEEMQDILVSLKMEMTGVSYFALCICIIAEKGWESFQKKDITGIISSMIFVGGIGYGAPLMKKNTYGFVACQTDSDIPSDNFRRQAIEQIANILDTVIEFNYTIGVGSLCFEITRLSESFIEASAAAGYRIFNCHQKIIDFNQVRNSPNKSSWYTLEDLAGISKMLRRGDKGAACHAIMKMLSDAQAEGNSILIVKSMCTEIVNTLIKNIFELNISYKYEELFNYDSLHDLEEKLLNVVCTICDEVNHRISDQRKDLLIESIKNNIQENLGSYKLSLNSVATDLGLSISHISKTIKVKTGKTFTEYVTELRLDCIKNQLSVTDRSIADIINDVGYFDESSFIRKFKSLEGVTPGEYRKIHSI